MVQMLHIVDMLQMLHRVEMQQQKFMKINLSATNPIAKIIQT